MFQYNVDPGHCSEETVGNLRQRLNVMREIVRVSHVMWEIVGVSHVMREIVRMSHEPNTRDVDKRCCLFYPK